MTAQRAGDEQPAGRGREIGDAQQAAEDRIPDRGEQTRRGHPPAGHRQRQRSGNQARLDRDSVEHVWLIGHALHR